MGVGTGASARVALGRATEAAACIAIAETVSVTRRADLLLGEISTVAALAFVAALVFSLPATIGMTSCAKPRSKAIALVPAAAALAAYAVDADVLCGLYPRLHAIVGILAVSLATIALHVLRRESVSGVGPRLLVTALTVAWGSLGFVSSYAIREYARSDSVVLADFLRIVVPRGTTMPSLSPRALAWLGSERAGSRPSPRPKLVLVVTIDALRYDIADTDRDGAFAALRRDSVWFTTARTVAPATTPSTYALWSSRGPWSVSWRRAEYDRHGFFPIAPHSLAFGWPLPLDETAPTLPETLVSSGWSAKVCASIPFQTPTANVTRGFEVLHDRDWSGPANQLRIGTDASKLARCGEEAIDAMTDQPLLLWLHFTDAHAPYREHAETPPRGSSSRAMYESDVRYIERYVTELVEHADSVVGRDRTLLVLSADHGEEFGEHGGRFHGVALHEEILRIPLVIRHPSFGSREVTEPVSLLDLAPTILDVAGAPSLPDAEGKSLLPLLLGEKSEPRPMLAETADAERPHRAVISGPFKLIYEPQSYALYDLAADPLERRVITDEHMDTAREMAKLIGVPPP